MAKIVENKKGFMVIECTAVETMKFGGIGICDYCNEADTTGYYIAVLNCWYCRKCYTEWMERAIFYEEDAPFEKRNFEYYKELLGLKDNE
ncbi:MAG: demethylase [Bacteroidaceae bacterium]|nr:demethylase [Bacteroidaceae bacterium]